MNKIIFLIISLIIGIKTFSQSTCESSLPWTEECIIYPSPYPSIITRCYNFSGIDSVQFAFFRAAGVGTCLDIQDTYTLYDQDCNLLEENVTGVFNNLDPNLSYTMCYTVNCPTDGGIVLICSSELTSLPIDLLYFTYVKFDGKIKLVWSTGYELNNNIFMIWSSQDMINWINIGSVEGVGSSHTAVSYSFIWDRPRSGNNYFRLDQIDFNGVVTSYDIIVVNFNEKEIKDNMKGYNVLGQKIIVIE
jgi:hypothetical protein